MKNLIAVFLIIFNITTALASANDSFSTHNSKGNVIATFERVSISGFEAAWKAPNGIIWSDVVQINLANIPTNDLPLLNNLIQKSQAVDACATMGARLPTKEEYRVLQGYFELWEKNQALMSKVGLADFHEMFPGARNEFLWSSSGKASDLLGAFYFSGYSGSMEFGSFNYLYSVQCVKP